MDCIILMCSQGMSTSLMVRKMKEEAEKTGYQCEIEAYSVSDIDEVKQRADVILLGPQIRYKLEKLQEQCKDIPMAVIDQMDYGTMNGKKVLAMAKEMIGA